MPFVSEEDGARSPKHRGSKSGFFKRLISREEKDRTESPNDNTTPSKPQSSSQSSEKPVLTSTSRTLSKQSTKSTHSDPPLTSRSTGSTHSSSQAVSNTPANDPATLARESSGNSTDSVFNAEHGTQNRHVGADGLTRADVKALFSGAPLFMLEKGRHGRFFPQTLYPWNNQLDVADLLDRRILRHESFGLCTLHAHLPIPDEYKLISGVPRPVAKPVNWKGASFEVGVFEMPNMLGYEGREVGTIGMRHFLEIPAADTLRSGDKPSPDEDDQHGSEYESPKDLLNMSFTDALKTMSKEDGSFHIGKHAPRLDRSELIRGGPKEWKRIGLRDISMKHIVNRLTEIGKRHDEVVAGGAHNMSILDSCTVSSLYRELFTKFLYAPTKISDHEDPYSMKVQTESLVKTLATPGAWFDFSQVEWRTKIGRILWETQPKDGRDFHSSHPEHGSERKWLLVQIVLSIELMIRLDAVIKLGIATNSEKLHVTPSDIHHFNHLRNRKTDWDFVLSRRFIDHFRFESAAGLVSDQTSPMTDEQSKGLRQRLLRRVSSNHPAVSSPLTSTESPWDLILLPRRAKEQAEGLVRFAQGISWPDVAELERQLHDKLAPSHGTMTANPHLHDALCTPVDSRPGSPSLPPSAPKLGRMFSRTGDPSMSPTILPDRSHVTLQPASETSTGSWLSRSWLTGMVLPGEPISHFLLAALLENDPNHAVSKLGDQASLYGGFVLDQRSWWSKFCIISRVFGSLDGSEECMGWVSLPNIVPNHEDGTKYSNGWFDVKTEPVRSLRETLRLYDGQKLAHDSSPLGSGQGKVTSQEFRLPSWKAYDESSAGQVIYNGLTLRKAPGASSGVYTATADFVLKNGEAGQSEGMRKSFQLLHDVYFIAAQPCRLPHGHAKNVDTHIKPQHKHAEHLPAHPLHNVFHYKVVPVQDLSPQEVEKGDSTDIVKVIDARGRKTNDAFARAWCAEIGQHAIVAREGRTCISCCVREARALDVGFVLRIGLSTD